MKYTKMIAVNGDQLCKTLLKYRYQYGDNWTDAMASYAIAKSHKIPLLSWREVVPNGIKTPQKQYISFTEV